MKISIMKKNIIPLVFLFCCFLGATPGTLRLFPAEEIPLTRLPQKTRIGLESITKEDGLSYIEFLSCDELEGRDTASQGERIARRYITSLYKLWRITPAGDLRAGERSYEQRIRVDIMENLPETEINITVGPRTRRFFHGADVFGASSPVPGAIRGAVAFVGYGIHAPELGYDDFSGIDLENKIALFFLGVPGAENSRSPFSKPETQSLYIDLRKKMEEVKKRGAIALVLISPGEISTRTLYKYPGGGRIVPPRRLMIIAALDRGGAFPSFVVTENVINFLLSGFDADWKSVKESIDTSLKPSSIEFPETQMAIETEAQIKADVTANLLGMVEGSDPKLRDEVVIVGAHLDHFGLTEDRHVFNGADDNASGSAAVLEIAQAFALQNVKPRRTIIFAHWTGEERGLLGSRYFAEFSTAPPKKIVACLNLDMIGREFTPENKDNWKRRFGPEASLQGINTEDLKRVVMIAASSESPELREIIVTMSRDQLGLIPVLRGAGPGQGGDEESFHAKKIPSVLFSAAMHSDYHTPDDTVEKISGEKFQQITRLAYLIASEISDRDERLSWNENRALR
jgi:hypothetical protein